jgi:hypothetical protein
VRRLSAEPRVRLLARSPRPKPGSGFWSAVFALGAVVSVAAPAQAAERSAFEPRGTYAQPFATFGVGRGLRFNNPFRLETQLGDDAESLSLTATYLDFGAGAAFGDPSGFRHGAVVHFSIALEGITQEVLTPSYTLIHPLFWDLTGYARAGFPLVLEPDLGAGVELAAGVVWFVTAGAGVSAELVGDLFFGAATWERDPSVIPVASLQLGAWFEYEVLP